MFDSTPYSGFRSVFTRNNIKHNRHSYSAGSKVHLDSKHTMLMNDFSKSILYVDGALLDMSNKLQVTPMFP